MTRPPIEKVSEKVSEFCKKTAALTQADSLVVGVSGGPDSLCLLHLLKALAPALDLNLTVAHLNHQLREGDSMADAQFVRDLAQQWHLPLVIESFDVAQFAREHKFSLEAAARQIRYTFLWRVAIDVGANRIAVGHNADDQAETVLMHFLRGSGLTGLRGMLPVVRIEQLQLNPSLPLPEVPPVTPTLIRPLLEVSRREIEAYCQANRLAPRRDSSNQDTRFLRNRIRHELLPLLETYNPNIRQTLQRTAMITAAEVDFLTDQADHIWPSVVKQASADRILLDLNRWRQLSLAMKRAMLRRAAQTLRRELQDLSFDHIESALDIIERGTTGAKATLPQNMMLTIGYNTLTVADKNEPSFRPAADSPYLATSEIIPLRIPGTTSLPQTEWQLKADVLDRQQISDDQINQTGRWEVYLDADVVGHRPVLRPRRPGDIIYLSGMSGHRKKVKTFMIDAKIPASRRESIPLLVANNRVLWVCGYRADERGLLSSGTGQVLHFKFETKRKRT